MNAIETMYNGYTFRSMLEARWFAFLELLESPGLYEPFELYGYIPDFVLAASGLLVEVKPIASYRENCNDHFEKIVRSKWLDRSAVVGGGWFLGKKDGYHAVGQIHLPDKKLVVPLLWGEVHGTFVWFTHDEPKLDLLTGNELPMIPSPLSSRNVKLIETRWGVAHSYTRWKPR